MNDKELRDELDDLPFLKKMKEQQAPLVQGQATGLSTTSSTCPTRSCARRRSLCPNPCDSQTGWRGWSKSWQAGSSLGTHWLLPLCWPW
ncbi:MAG: hypothetical protein IPN76_01385 [Saprospiraceae bacterium]|nr:hypothetical protein [Saprospiraceae bacterium]